jgi:diguanylate cyclase (GGDEF)-like protein/PAS domain S-box-containing protein
LPVGSVQALEPVTLQLKWSHAFQFAGYYAAQEKGYYREAGLEVSIRAAGPGVDPLEPVLAGAAQFGVGTSSLLLARNAGRPVVVLAVVFQHSPLVLVARQTSSTQGIHDLVGKRVMIEPQSDELVAYLRQEGIALDRLTRLEHSFQPRDLIEGKVDAISAYVSNEPFYLDQAGFAYQVYTPRSAGIDFYGDNLFTTEQELTAHPQRVRAFREASLRGWQYAMAHPEEIADLIVAKYSSQHPREFYLYEARRMAPLLRPDLIEVGYMNRGRWRHIADTYADLGLLPRNLSLDGFLYEPEPHRDLTWFYLGLALLAAIGSVALYVHGVNRRLAAALDDSRRAAQALRQSEERHRLLADHATDVIWTMDLEGRFTYVSPSVEKLRGYTVPEVMAQSIDEALTPTSAAIAKDGLGRTFAALHAGEPVPEFRGELEQPCKGGGTVWTEVTTTGMYNEAGKFIGILGVTRDISERKRAEERIQHLAQHDPLTDLPNRALFSDRLAQALAVARRDGQRLAVMFVDLDKFKPINDNFGHAVGDQLLQQVARRLRDCLRESDTVARIGGDEFVVLMRSVREAADVLVVADKIRQALGRSFPVACQDLMVSASIGIALCPDHGDSEIELTQKADAAMYDAKRGGCDQVRLFQGTAP